jgi:phage-related protein
MPNVGSAYVTLMPSMRGFAGSLAGEFGGAGKAAGSTFGTGLGDGVEAGSSRAQGALTKLGGVARAAGTIAVAGFAALSSAVAAIGGAALSAYADYEQLVGGVDTLFGNASGTLQNYAAEAYKTCGMSANQYMEQATSFAASLVQSCGGDTAAAAEYANTAMQDMSDNVNKMGSDMEDVQNAYQGFAKGNFTMLDNLKLGYGGTKSEMERLIADANELRAAQGLNADLTIDSYADVVEAIHTVQENMGITGTTAKEAATTISGSIGMAKAAWQNWLTGLGRDDVDFSKLTNELLESIGAVAKNVAPRVAQIGKGIIEAFPAVLAGLGDVLTPIISEALASAWNIAVDGLAGIGIKLPSVDSSQVVSSLDAIGNAASSAFESVTETFAPAGQALSEAFAPVADQVATQLMPALSALGQALGNLVSAILPVISAAIQAIAPVLSAIVGGVVQLASAIATGLTPIINNVAAIIQTALPVITGLFQAFGTTVSGVINAVFPFIESVITTVMSVVNDVISVVLALIQGNWEGVWNGIGQLASDVWNGIGSVVSSFMGMISGTIQSILAGIQGVWNTIWGAILGFLRNTWNSIKSAVSGAIGAVSGTIGSVLGSISSTWSSTWSSIKSFFSRIWSGIKSGASSGIRAVYSTVTGLKGQITGFFSGAGSWLVSSGKALLNGFTQGIKNGFSAAKNAVSNGLKTIRSFFPFSPAKQGPFSGRGYTTWSGKALMGDFAKSIKSQAGVVAAATGSVLAVAQEGLSAQLTASPSVSASRSAEAGRGISDVISLLEEIANKDPNVYMDSTKVSSALAARSRVALAGSGIR